MNCILSNANAFVYDRMMASVLGPMIYDSETFATPYGLVYPLSRGWEILRMMQDVDQPEDLMKETYLRRYMPVNEHRVLYLDWNARLWLIRMNQLWKDSKAKNTGAHLVLNGIPQASHTVFLGREMGPVEQAALNLAMRECNSYQEAFALLEKSTTERFADPVFLSLEQHRASKPAGAINMPNPIASMAEDQQAESYC